jgi:hypothetical protein
VQIFITATLMLAQRYIAMTLPKIGRDSAGLSSALSALVNPIIAEIEASISRTPTGSAILFSDGTGNGLANSVSAPASHEPSCRVGDLCNNWKRAKPTGERSLACRWFQQGNRSCGSLARLLDASLSYELV